MRYTDNNLSLHRNDDFVTRNRVPSVIQFGILFAIDMLIVTAAYHVTDSFLIFALVTFLMLGIADAIMVWAVQRSRDQMLVTEFQNTLFSSALSVNNHFAIIVRKDGMVIYTDIGFRSLYSSYDRNLHRNLDDIFALTSINREDADKIYPHLMDYQPSSVIVHMLGGNHKMQKMFVSLDPIRRPQDYILIRGRPFVERNYENDPLAKTKDSE